MYVASVRDDGIAELGSQMSQDRAIRLYPLILMKNGKQYPTKRWQNAIFSMGETTGQLVSSEMNAVNSPFQFFL